MKTNTLSIVQMQEKLREGSITSRQLVGDCLDAVKRFNQEINALVLCNDKEALKLAEEADRLFQAGEISGPLQGIPITIKDHLSTKGICTTNSMSVFSKQIPDKDASVVKRLKDAGAIILGKTNLPFMAMDFQARSPVHGVTNNPWNIDHTSGGSTAGAAAVAAMMTPLDIGSDLAGSLRIPAHFCGVFSLRPTDHAVPRTGMHPTGKETKLRHGRNMGVPGPVARSLSDLEIVAGLIQGPDEKEPELGYMMPADKKEKELKFLWMMKWPGIPQDSAYRRVLQEFEKNCKAKGVHLEKVEKLPFIPADVYKTFGGLLSLEMMRFPLHVNLLYKLLSPRGSSRFSINNTQINQGRNNYEYYLQKRDRTMAAFENFLSGYDGLICPVTASPAPRHIIPEKSKNQLVLPYRNVNMGNVRVGYAEGLAGMTIPFSVTGSPVVTMPLGLTDNNLPVGIQVVGSRFHDLQILQNCRQLNNKLEIALPVMEKYAR